MENVYSGRMKSREEILEYLSQHDGHLYSYAQRRVMTDLLLDIRDLLVAQQKPPEVKE